MHVLSFKDFRNWFALNTDLKDNTRIKGTQLSNWIL